MAGFLTFSLTLLATIAVDATFHMPSPYSWRCENSVCVKQQKSAVQDTGVSHATCKLTCGPNGALWPKPVTVKLSDKVQYTLPQNIHFHWDAAVKPEIEEILHEAVIVFRQNMLKTHPEYEAFQHRFDHDDFNYGFDTFDHGRQNKPRQNNRRARHEISSTKFYHYHSQEHEQQDHDKYYDERFFSGHHFFDSQSPDILNMTVKLNVEDKESPVYLQLDTNEEYSLTITSLSSQIIVDIKGKTFFGVRHGLETLSQLMDYDEERDSLQVVKEATITDKPAYPYRGLIVDTARNFMSVEALERTLCAMAASKLNTFHWHITDSNSFPMYLNSLPKMAYYGAHKYNKIYYPEDIQHIVHFGRIRGIRVLPELDAPAHVGNGWQWGKEDNLGNLAVCVNQEPWQKYCVQPPCGQLNLANQNIYPVLGKIYKEMIKNFGPLDLFHYGGDEVNVNCWKENKEIRDWMKNLGKDGTKDEHYYQIWADFQHKAHQEFTKANQQHEIPGIIWTSHLTENNHARTDDQKYLDKTKYIVQIWSNSTDPHIKKLLEDGYRVIFSNFDTMYLDCGFGNWVDDGNNWCSPFKEWQKFYETGPKQIARKHSVSAANHKNILGGEAALWSEKVDEQNLDSRVWPRAAALAERLWSDPEEGWKNAEHRFINHRQRLVERGVRADRIQPEWCHQNQGLCYYNKDFKN